MDLVRRVSGDDSEMKRVSAGRVGAQGRCCKQTKKGLVGNARALTRSTLQDLSVCVLCEGYSFPTTSMCGVFVVRCSYSPSFMCCVHNVWCSHSPSFLCVFKQRWFSAHDWRVNASSPCKWFLVGHRTCAKMVGGKLVGFAAVVVKRNEETGAICRTDGHTEDHGLCPRGLRFPRTAGDEGEEE